MKKPTRRNQKRNFSRLATLPRYEQLENRQMLAGDSFWVYYGEGNKLFRSLNDGTQKQELMALTIQPGPVNADGIMVDLDRVNNKIYAIANQGHNPIHLYRSNLDGSNRELLNNSDSMGTILQGIAVNEQTGAVYVSPHSLVVRTPGSAPGGMLRITNNGQTVTPFSQKPWYVTDMEVDAANGHVYYAVWPSYGGGVPAGWAGIRRMNLDGSNDIGIFQTGGNGSFALDTANNRIWFASTYSSSLQNDKIYSINLTGGSFQEKATVAGYTFGDIDLSESKDGIVFSSFPKTGNPNPNARIQQLAFTSTTAVPLFDTPNISSGIELLAATSNNLPTLDVIGNRVVDEDISQQTVNLSGITAGGGENQPLRVTASSNNAGLIPNPTVNYTSANTTGSLSFTPVANQSGTAALTVTVEDGGPDGNLSTTGDNATFSRTFQVTVNPVNDAPTLDISASPALESIFEAAIDPSGTTIANIVIDDSITDPDGKAVEAIAITSLDTSLGSWQYKLSGTSNWLTIDTKLINSQTNELALLLGHTAKLRLVPFGTLAGSLRNAISFRAWDQSSGTEGQYIIISGTGGVSSFSSNADTASMAVIAANNAPTFFLGDGKVRTDFGPGEDTGSSIVIQPDGRILMGGYSYNGSNFDFALSRYLANGTLDTSFGIGGKVTTPVGGGGDVGEVVKVQADGKIVLCGYIQGSSNDFALVRFNSDGSLDTSFGVGGKVTTAIGPGNENGNHLVIQTDGKIIVAGFSFNGSNDDFALVRYNADGALDPDFGTGGKVTTGIGPSDDGASSLTLQPDGKIVVGGSSYNGSASSDFALVRYNSNGTQDTSFGIGGKVTVTIGDNEDYGYDVAVQLDGKILLGGWSRNQSQAKNNFALLRFNTDGSLDNSFGTGGKVSTAIGPTEDVGWSVEVQPDNKILLGGYSWSGAKWNLALVRYYANGSLDTDFGVGGKVTTAIGNGRDIGISLALQPDQKILLGGFSSNGVNDDFAFVRYNSDGSLDLTLDPANSLGGTIQYAENAAPIVLDSDVSIFDAELTAADSYGGSTLTLARNGGADAGDLFSATGSLGSLTQGGSLLLGGVLVGVVTTNSGGELSLSFNASATNSLVNSVMRQIAYSIESDAPPASVQINWNFSDGNSGGQGSGGTLIANGSVTVIISSVNDPPTLDSLPNLAINEDAMQQTVNLSGISSGRGDSQPLRVTASSSNVGLISDPKVNYISANTTGSISFTPDANQSGTATITVTVEDGGPDGDLGTTADNATFSRTFQVTVNPVNDAPTLNALSNLTVSRNAPLQTINLSGITAGGGESQPLRVSANSDNSALIPNPNVNYSSANNTGSISFTPVPNQAGVATITVTVEDGGLDGDLSTTGDNATITRTFTVSVGGSQWLYYLENGVLSRSSPDGSNPTALVQSTEQGWAIKNFDLDTVNNRIYYAEENGVTNSRILSVDMLGQNPIMISQNAAGKGNYSMAVDGLNQAVYLHSHDVPPLAPAGPFFEGRIQKISYQGVLTLLPPVLWYVHDMEIDAAANTLYFTADVNSEGLFKCDLNGNAITSLSNDSGVMRNIAISRLRNKIIYTNVNDTNNTSSIFIMNPDGTEKVKLGDYVGAGIDDVELDDEAGLIYFATTLDGIFKTSLTTFAPVQVLPGEKKEIELYFASNTPPTIDVIGNRTVYRNAPQQTVSLSGITAGGGELQPLRVTASSNNTGLIPNPTVNYSSANTTGSLSFTPVANQTGTATITVTVEDGGFDGDLNTTGDNATFSRTFQVNVNRISDVPVLTNLGGDVSYRENVVTARLCNAVQVADADTQVFANGTLQIAIESGGESADRLWLTNSKYLTVNGNGLYFNGLLVGNFSGGTNGQPLEVTFNNRASVNRVQHVLRCVCFAHDSEAPQATQRLIAIQLNDGAGGQAAATKRVNVIPVDDRLALTGVPVTSTYTLNSTVIRIAPAAVLTDPDSPGFGGGSLRVRFTSAADSSNRLLLGGGFTIDANNNVLQNGVIIGTRNAGGGIGMTELQLSFNSKATREVVQQLMRGLSFKTVNGTSKSSRTIEFSLNNGDGGSNIATTRIDVA